MIKAITQHFVVCPHCDETTKSTIDHLKDGFEIIGWHCNHCGRGFGGIIKGADTVITKDPNESRRIQILTLLEYPPSDKPLRFLLAGHRYESKRDKSRRDSRFFYEEHSCPTNWIGESEMIAFDGDTDPHGFLRYVREVDRPDLPDNDGDAALRQLFPEMESQTPVAPPET